MSKVFVNSKPFKIIKKERMNKWVRPFANKEDAVSYTPDKNTITMRKSMKKSPIQKHGSDSETDEDSIA